MAPPGTGIVTVSLAAVQAEWNVTPAEEALRDLMAANPEYELLAWLLGRSDGSLLTRGPGGPLTDVPAVCWQPVAGDLGACALQDECMEKTDAGTGWISCSNSPGGKDHLAPDVRAEVERREALREERRGRLLCDIHVQVYERDAEMYVTFPAGAALDAESDPGEIAAAVARGRERLGTWR